MSDLFFTSDEHYGHENILKFCNRPFKTVWDYIDHSIKTHNAKVPKGARVYHLGDLFWRTLDLKKALDIINELNGQHYFIWGNHDELMEKNEILRSQFVWTKDIAQVYHPLAKHGIVICHYAMRSWRNSHKGAWHLYGHTHGALPEQYLSFDAGVDANGYAPISIEEVAARMEAKVALGGTHAVEMLRYANALREAAAAETELLGSLLLDGEAFGKSLIGRAERVEGALKLCTKQP